MRLLVMAAAAASIVACAPARQLSARDLVVGFEVERPAARADLREGEESRFLERAVGVLHEEGHRIAARSPIQVVTAPRVTDFRCGAATCRAQEVTMVHLSGLKARVEIVRAVRTPASTTWQMELDDAQVVETAAREARLLQAMLGNPRRRVELSQR